ncbi:MAG: Ig-like domain-containing protein [Pseudomonadota bacterium]
MKVRTIWLILLACPLLATLGIWLLFVQSGYLEKSLKTGIDASLAAIEPEPRWARVSLDGREATLRGQAPDADAIEKVRSAIALTPGIRAVQNLARVRAWGNLKAPTVTRMETNSRTPVVTGTWQGDIADGLSVEIAGRLFVLGEDRELSAEGTSWSLAVPDPLADGAYDLNVTIWKAEDSAADVTDDDLEIDTQPPPPPVVTALSTNRARPVISGSWPHEEAVGLEITIANRTYRLGRDRELKAGADGTWELSLPVAVEDGTTEVAATAIDAVGNRAVDTSSGELRIDVTPPLTPTVNSFETSRSFTLTGTWAESDAVELSVRLDGKLYLYKLDPELRSDGKGNWTLVPSSLPGEGQYDVVVTTKDLAGNVSTDQTTNELVIKFKSEDRPGTAFEEFPRPLNPYLCQSEFRRLLAESAVEFEGGRAELTEHGRNTVDALAGIASRCPAARIEVGVHTDSIGDFSVNRRLSQARAITVVRQLIKRGIDRSRLSGVGYGEIRPIATNKTESGRAKNRRVELFVKQ